MKTLTSESYNIAWFKLADFVARGEKERALSVMRLFMHSVSNEALTQQLEGDILLAFNDHTVHDRYYSAANLFKKSGNLHQAANAYQQALEFKDNEQILELLLEIYAQLKLKTKLSNTCTKIAKIMLQKNSFKELQIILDKTLSITDPSLHVFIYAPISIALLLHDQNNNQIQYFLQKTIKLFQLHQKLEYATHDFQKFLTHIKIINHDEYKKIEQLLQDNYE